jgi:hypothetical protein
VTVPESHLFLRGARDALCARVLDPTTLDRTTIVTTLRALLLRYRDELVRVDRELVPQIRELTDQLRRVEAARYEARDN